MLLGLETFKQLFQTNLFIRMAWSLNINILTFFKYFYPTFAASSLLLVSVYCLNDLGKRVIYFNQTKMTDIINGTYFFLFGHDVDLEADGILGICHRSNHWTLIVRLSVCLRLLSWKHKLLQACVLSAYISFHLFSCPTAIRWQSNNFIN